LYIGIGGGGRCKTGPRSGTVIDWPELLWSLRGETSLPEIVEGGASEYVAETRWRARVVSAFRVWRQAAQLSHRAWQVLFGQPGQVV